MNKKLPIFGISVGGICAVMAAIICVNVVSAMVEINQTNQIIKENTKTPIEYEDDTLLTEGLTTYRYEAEKAKFEGFSSNGTSNYEHACSGLSLDFNEKYSGGVALHNIFSSPSLEKPNSFTFTVNSDKNVKLNALMRCSGEISSSGYTSFALGDFYQVKVNKKSVKITGKVPAADSFGLANTSFVLPLVEGENNIEIITKPYTSVLDGCFDYLELYTTATLSGFVESAWDMTDYKITLPPMENRFGTAEYICEECNKTYTCDSIPSINVGLEQGLYEKVEKEENDEKITEYYFKNTDKLVSSNPLPKTEQHTLTIESDYVTFEDGSKEQKVWDFYEFPNIISTLEGYHVIGWYDINDKDKIWDTKQFAMPTKDTTVVPIFDYDIYKEDLEQKDYEDFNEGKPKEEWERSPLYGTFNGKINLNDTKEGEATVTHKPIHSSAIVGFSHGKLKEQVYESILFDNNGIAEKATSYNYNKVEKDWTFLTCSSCKMTNKTKTFKVKIQNQGSSTINFDFWFATSSGNPTNNGNNPHVKGISLNKNDIATFELDVKFSNTNIMSYFKFNLPSSELKLVMTQYVDDVSQAPTHKVTLDNVPNSKYTVSFENGYTADVKEGKSLTNLVVNAPENYMLEGFIVDGDQSKVVSVGSFVMGNKDVTLTPVFIYQGGRVDLTQTIGNGPNFIHSTGLSGFNREKLAGGMKNELILKGEGDGMYYELSTIFAYEGGLSDTSKEYSFIIMAGYKVGGKVKVTYVLTNSGSETLRFTISQPNGSSAYADPSTPKTDMIELAPGQTKIVSLDATLGNSNVMGYFDFDCHTTTDMRLYVSNYISVA